jgi:DNA helicase-2/ATP-dependent DNA helicase PcrA
MEKAAEKILEGLNRAQREAVECTQGPSLIVAGAGSGKTRVLTSRVAYILAGGTEPWRVLALTFTKKAAGEMKERIALMVGEERARRVVAGTFHSVFVRFLRNYADALGYPANFTIYDTSDSHSALKTCIKELGLDDKVYKPKEMLSRISGAKNALVLPGEYRNRLELTEADARAKKPRTADVYELYQRKCKQAGVMDFDDILVNMNLLLRDFPEACAEIAGRFSYIMVDEYQDTNFAQYVIIRKLAAAHHNICVVGDDSQSIYAFRGAKIENILNFRKDYPECRIFRLERNYRSTRNIVGAANSLIAHNEGRIPKECYSEGEEGDRIRLINADSDITEAVLVSSAILERMRSDGAQYRDFAILYRTNAQSRALEEALRRRNLPYQIYSGNSFFERMEVKDLMAWFKLAVNPSDDEAFKRAIGKPSRGIGETTLAVLAEEARGRALSLYRTVAAGDLALKDAALQKLRNFCALVASFSEAVPTTDVYELARRIADASGLYAFYKADTSVEGQARMANVDELLNSVAAYIEEQAGEERENALITLTDYLENVSLLSNVDVAEGDEDDRNRIALMTVHSAKGLEFPYVFVVGLEENLFPSGGTLITPSELEEERRLCYVALTRAQKAVYVSRAESRLRNGKHEYNRPSRFLREIDPRFFENPPEQASRSVFSGFSERPSGFAERPFGRRPFTPSRPSASPSSRAVPGSSRPVETPHPAASPSRLVAPAKPDIIDPGFVPVPMTELFEGERIEHNRFGGGTILNISGAYPEMKARINFDIYGEKLLLLKYAKLRPEKR